MPGIMQYALWLAVDFPCNIYTDAGNGLVTVSRIVEEVEG